jgi:hypothetical protein
MSLGQAISRCWKIACTFGWRVFREGTDTLWPFAEPRHARLEPVLHAIVRTTPPSTRKEVPVVADACSEQT